MDTSVRVADPSDLYDAARKQAFADAREKAELYADVAGIDLDGIRYISESQNYNQPMPMAQTAMYDRAASAPVPIEGGELTFAINVSVTWALGAE